MVAGMHISDEGKIGIGLALLFGLGTGVVIRFPDQLWIGTAMMVLSAFGLILLAMHHFDIKKRKMIPAIGLIACGLGLFGFHERYLKTSTPQASAEVMPAAEIAPVPQSRKTDVAPSGDTYNVTTNGTGPAIGKINGPVTFNQGLQPFVLTDKAMSDALNSIDKNKPVEFIWANNKKSREIAEKLKNFFAERGVVVSPSTVHIGPFPEMDQPIMTGRDGFPDGEGGSLAVGIQVVAIDASVLVKGPPK